MNKYKEIRVRTAFFLASLLALSLTMPARLLAQGEDAANSTIQETHALIEELVLGKAILQNYWHKLDFPQYNHFDDAIWTIDQYSGDECEIVYRRTFKVSHKAPETVKPIYGDKPKTMLGYKTVRFDMTKVETVEVHDYGDSRGSIPSVGIRFVGPAREWRTNDRAPRKRDLARDPVIKPDHAISVTAKDAHRILKSFQHVQALCQAVDDENQSGRRASAPPSK
jgi:hypothetical protein